MNKRWVLVTGGTRGIGRGLVESLCQADYDVVFTYRASRQSADILEQEMAALGKVAVGYLCDSTDEQGTTALANELLASRGAPYAVINNAGITRDAPMMQMSSEQWNEVVNINLNGVFNMIRHFIRPMIENGDGVILQMSSVSGQKGNVGQTNYSATKAGLSGMTRSLALELARFNVRVNAIAPGYIATEMVEEIPERQMKTIVNSIPLRRIGPVAEVTGMVNFMLSAAGAYITGQTFVIDGGLAA